MNPKPHIVIAGGSGYLGRALAAHFHALGHEIVILSRTPKAAAGGVREIAWDARSPGGWVQELEGAAAIINLTGRSVNCRYNAPNRRAIMDSRVNSTRVIGQAIANCKAPPPVWLNASTATLYTHTLGPAWTESGEMDATPAARDKFSVDVGMAWEKALNEVPTPRTRKVAMRMTMVFGPGNNSVFPVMRRLTRLGLGGRLGSGKQYVSWIHEVDFCRAVEWLITHDQFRGPVNLCAPNPLPNAEMMKTFRDVCRVPFGLPAAEWMLEVGAFFLQTETELLLKSRRVVPGKLLESGFEFHFSHLRPALEELERKARE